MTPKQVKENLCYYNPENPNGCDDPDVVQAHESELAKTANYWCMCDNCFYGRTVLAEEILRLTKETS